MKIYFDENTDKRLLEAQTKEEVMAIIAGTTEAEKLADKADEIMAEIARIKGTLDEEVDLDELDGAAGGAKRQDVYLSETQGCIATFWLQDQLSSRYCSSSDQCWLSNEYKYHNTKWANCPSGGKHSWEYITYEYTEYDTYHCTENTYTTNGYRCKKCDLKIKDTELGSERFND